MLASGFVYEPYDPGVGLDARSTQQQEVLPGDRPKATYADVGAALNVGRRVNVAGAPHTGGAQSARSLDDRLRLAGCR